MKFRVILLTTLVLVILLVGPVSLVNLSNKNHTAAIAASSTSACPRVGGTLIKQDESEPSDLNDYLGGGTSREAATEEIYSTLVIESPTNVLQGDLATSWSISSDGLTYTFNIVHNATWSDGVPLTAQDVAWTYTNMIQPGGLSQFSTWNASVASVTAPDNYTVAIHLRKVYPPFLLLLGTPGNIGPLVMPQHLFAGTNFKTNPYSTAPVGSGPFVFKDWVKGDHVDLVANPHYFKAGLPCLAGIVVKFISNTNTALTALETGQVDFIHYLNIDPSSVPTLMADKKLAYSTNGTGLGALEIMMFNLRNPILNNSLVRQAIDDAIDKKLLNYEGLAGAGTQGTSVISSSVVGFYNPNVPVYPYNTTKAAALLDQAGYKVQPNGTRFTLRLTAALGRSYDASSLDVIKYELSLVKINVVTSQPDRTTFLNNVYSNWDFDMAANLRSSGPDPELSIPSSYSTSSINHGTFTNAMGYSNPQVDALFAQEGSEQNATKRAAEWNQIQSVIMTNLPVIPLFEIPVDNFFTNTFHRMIMTSSFIGPNTYTWSDAGTPSATTTLISASSTAQSSSTAGVTVTATVPPTTATATATITSTLAPATVTSVAPTTIVSTVVTSASASSNVGTTELIAGIIVLIVVVAAAVAFLARRRGAP